MKPNVTYKDCINLPEVGDTIYVDSEMFMSRGLDDIVGGKTKVINTREQISGGDPMWFVQAGVNGTHYNWSFLEKKQGTLAAKFGESNAYRDPDDRIEFNRW